METLVLGGGAAKGYAHIGVIKFLEECGYKPDMVVGASMGALVGGFYAAGFPIKDLEEIAKNMDVKMKQRLFPLQISTRGLIKGDSIVKFLNTYIGKKKIENLPITFASVATDLEQNCEIVIHKGDLVQAIRSSISIPVVFVPHVHHGRTLIDGGFVSPVPISAALGLGATKIIAINVLRRVRYPSKKITKTKRSERTYSIFDVLLETVDYATSRLIDYQETYLRDGFMININTRGVKLRDFEKARDAITKGYTQAKKYRQQIVQSIGE